MEKKIISLEKFFNKKFKSEQIKIITLLNENIDTLGILPTGFGKSLIYQSFFKLTDKSIIVISPLIALMHDQKKEIDVYLDKLNKNKNNTIYYSIVTNCFNFNDFNYKNKYVIFTTPEWLFTSFGINLIKKLVFYNNLSLIAIDEIHCLDIWGNDFRENYKKLFDLKNLEYLTCPILGLSATLSNSSISYIKNVFRNNYQIISHNLKKENININITYKSPDNIIKLLKKMDYNKRILIYCQTKKEIKYLINIINKKLNYNNDNKIVINSYFAELTNNEKQYIQNQFMLNNINCLISTIAFGMGINIPIKYVIHYGIPVSLENYYQEIGRAGRDGTNSFVYLLYNIFDINKQKFILENTENTNNIITNYYRWKNIIKYILSIKCRQNFVLEYFNSLEEINYKCKKCDNCLNNSITIDKTEYIFYILYLIRKSSNYCCTLNNLEINFKRKFNVKSLIIYLFLMEDINFICIDIYNISITKLGSDWFLNNFTSYDSKIYLKKNYEKIKFRIPNSIFI